MDTIICDHLLFAALCWIQISSKDLKWVHLDSKCKHTWTAVTSSGGLEYLQRCKQTGITVTVKDLDHPSDRQRHSITHLQTKSLKHHFLVACQSVHEGNSRRGMDHGEEHITAAGSSSSQWRRHHTSEGLCVRGHLADVFVVPSLSKLSSPLCLCVIDTRRRGEAACDISAAVFFMQLHRHRQDTSNHAHRCHHCARVCVCVWQSKGI